MHFESRYFLTFLYLPPAEDAARTESWLYEGKAESGVDPHEVLRSFADRSARVLQLIENFMPECVWLDDTETLTYLHSTVSTHRQHVRVPETPIYLDALLADQPLIGGLSRGLAVPTSVSLRLWGFRVSRRRACSTTSTVLPLPIAGQPAPFCSTRPMPPSFSPKSGGSGFPRGSQSPPSSRK